MVINLMLGTPWRMVDCCTREGLVIPQDSKLIPNLLREFHDFVIGGHAGEIRTY